MKAPAEKPITMSRRSFIATLVLHPPRHRQDGSRLTAAAAWSGTLNQFQHR